MNHSKKIVFKSALDFDGRPMQICLEKIAEQKRLLRVAQSTLPEPIAEHAMHCVVSDTRLIIYTDSAVWASQIRFFQEVILNKIQGSGQRKITNMQIKVMPPIGPLNREREARVPTSETVQALMGQINDKSSDVLDVAMAKLAKTLSRRLTPEDD
jgi:hypothetical protein